MYKYVCRKIKDKSSTKLSKKFLSEFENNMKINNFYKITAFIKSKITAANRIENQKASNIHFEKIVQDSFRRQSYSEKIQNSQSAPNAGEIAHNIMKSFDEFSPECYKILSPEEIRAMRSKITLITANKAEITAETGTLLKNYFDKKYGQGNYTFISIGRSLGTIAQYMKYSGADAKCIPLSGLSQMTLTVAEDIVYNKRFQEYKKYLYEVFGKPEELKQSKKTYIVSDYCFTGSTLKIAEKIISHRLTGLKSRKIKYFSVEKIFEKIAIQNNMEPQKIEIIDKYLNSACQQEFDIFAPILRLDWEDLGNVRDSLNPPKTESRKMFQFCLSDILLNRSV